MILGNFKAFPASGVLVGIDWGARRTGVAVSDPSRQFVFVREPITGCGAQDLVARIVDLARDTRAVGIVVGLPLRMDGTESETTAMVRAFADTLSHATDLPIAFIDETLSSAAAQGEMGRVRRRDIKEKLDSNSARVILENAIAMMTR